MNWWTFQKGEEFWDVMFKLHAENVGSICLTLVEIYSLEVCLIQEVKMRSSRKSRANWGNKIWSLINSVFSVFKYNLSATFLFLNFFWNFRIFWNFSKCSKMSYSDHWQLMRSQNFVRSANRFYGFFNIPNFLKC